MIMRGYMQIDFYNWETQELEHLGEIPLSKINDTRSNYSLYVIVSECYGTWGY
jgi:hypothetical protein